MDFLKKHPFLVIYIVLMIGAVVFKIGGGWILLGSLGYLLLVALIRLPNTCARIGYFAQGVMKKKELAFHFYEFAFRHGSTAAAPKVAYAMQLMEKCRYEESKQALEDVLVMKDLQPTLLKIVRQDLAIAYWNCGELEKAIDTLENMKEDYDLLSAEYYTTLGYFYIEAKDYDKAAEATEEALKLDEGNGGAYDNLALIEYEQGHMEEAKELFHKALEMKESLASSKYYLGLIYEAEGDIETARTYFSGAYNSRITGMNTVSREQVDAKYNEYLDK
ncbi:MAG: tetratricopeptide repeat protein [Firmicutes bacterium]|nr:tetratricopeptide repeat protein [Bacillota bacterium]